MIDAFATGFLIGNREDSEYQLSEEHTNVDLPQGFMDVDYENPDLNRFLEKYDEREPQVAVVGDAYSREEAEMYQKTVDDLIEEYPNRRFVVAPKCREAFDVLDPETTTLGYANGNSKIQGEDLGSAKFRGWDVHILGGNPFEAYSAIEKLTQPTIDQRPPANVVGYDCNLPLRMAYWEFWTPDGWQDNGFRSPRETARRSYCEIKEFLKNKDVWPEIVPRELEGPAVIQPDMEIYIDEGGRRISSKKDLETAYVDDYEDYGVMAFESEVAKKYVEYREGLEKME